MSSAHIGRRTAAGVAGFSVAGAVAWGWACAAPTQIKLTITTNVECDALAKNGTMIFGDAVAQKVIASTRACSGDAPPRGIGSFVIAPSGARDARVALSVVAGVTRPSAECAAQGYEGCIVSRRRIRYEPGESLTLPIDLALECLSIACREDQTCSNGTCVPADVDDPAFCAGPKCTPAERADGGASDASASDAGDANVGDVVVPPSSTKVIANGARGLATDGTRLFFTSGANDIHVVPLAELRKGAVASTTMFRTGPGVANGLSIAAPYAIVAGQLDGGACAEVMWLADAGLVESITCPTPARGAALRILGGVQYESYVTSGPIWHSGADPRAVGYADGYLEAAEGTLFYTAGPYVWPDPYTTTDPPTSGPSDETLYGIAVAPKHFYVTTTSGRLLAFDRVTGANAAPVSPFALPPGAQLEDVLYVPGDGLYVATTDGVYRVTGIDDP